MELNIDTLNTWYKNNEKKIHEDFFRFLRFKSISTDPLYHKECIEAADWLIHYLKEMGMETELWTNPGLPCVYAEYKKVDSKRPTVLIYHHYDVQPVDPIDLWQSDPFEPTIRNNKVYARGASDNKGQCFATLTALKALFSLLKDLNVNIKLFIEGEEECGGLGTAATLKEKQKELKADYLLVIDFDIIDEKTPAINLGMRGITTFNVSCQNSKQDLHSGVHGGIALNPIRALVEVLSKVWDTEGKVRIEHFYDNVKPLSEEEKNEIDFSFDEDTYTKEFGVKAFSREKGYNPQESAWIRPTFEINGIWGGYTGVGFKTVLPAQAFAKISCRLVPDQDPEKIEKNLTEFLQKNIASGMQLHVEPHHGARAFRTSQKSTIVKLVAKCQEEVFNKKPAFTLSGGSVPIVVELAKASNAEVALFGSSLHSDDFHSPNEHFGLDRLKLGFLTLAKIIDRLSKQ